MRRLVLALTVSAAACLAASPAVASNPHHEEQDGCDHGATGKECRPDPSSNGKDCDVHGNHGGVNEDHCDQEVPTSTTTTTAPRTPITGPIELEVIEITTTTILSEPPILVPLPRRSPEPIVTTPTAGGSVGSVAAPVPMTELPATGSSPLPIALLGLALLLIGVAARVLGRR